MAYRDCHGAVAHRSDEMGKWAWQFYLPVAQPLIYYSLRMIDVIEQEGAQ